jgi:hypothetical protein
MVNRLWKGSSTIYSIVLILGSAGNIAIIWLYSKMIQPRTKAYKEIIVCFVEMRGDCMLC